MKTIIGLYEDMTDAGQTVAELIAEGIMRDNISLGTNPQVAREIEQSVGISTKHNPTIDAEHSRASNVKTGAAIGGVSGVLIGLAGIALPGIGAILGGLVGAGVGAAVSTLKEVDVADEDVGYYAEGVQRGGVLVATKVDDDDASDVIAVMKRHHPINVHERAKEWRKEGWTGYTPSLDATVQGATAASVAASPLLAGGQSLNAQPAVTGTKLPTAGNGYADKTQIAGETKIPVVEEELRVGKRQVDSGSVHVDTWTETEPVEQQVALHEEKVTVERHPVNRPASASDLSAFKAGSFEVTATSEEAVVEKRPRVVEEVVVKKTAQDRTETISDTVRKTKVDIKSATTGATAASAYDADACHRHYQTTYANSLYPYTEFEPAYLYGYELANDVAYQGRDWRDVEAEAQRAWEQNHQGSAWQEFKQAVQHGWESAKSAVTDI